MEPLLRLITFSAAAFMASDSQPPPKSSLWRTSYWRLGLQATRGKPIRRTQNTSRDGETSQKTRRICMRVSNLHTQVAGYTLLLWIS